MFLFAAFFAATVAADEGMWLLPYLQKMNIADMRAKGCELSAEEIYAADRSSLKDAIVIFGAGCTGEVVSPDGLLLTNHHCGYGAIQSLSSVEHDFLKNGFWARSRAEELPAPGLEVRFVRRIADVTADVLGAVPSTAMGEERAELVKKQVAEVRKRFGKEYSGMEISVKPFFGGNQYFAFAMEVYKDIRLVGTPPNSIGKFGGDTDNWMWPRHTGDFSMFRIYAGKDNRPAEYSTKNVPYRADEYLRISLDGYDEGDFAMIMGFPGSTQRYMTSYEIDRMLTITNPQRIFIRGERQKILAEDMLASDKVRIQYASKYAQSSNYWKNAMGMSRGIERLDVKRKKQEQERAFQQWAEANSVDGKRYDEALGMIRDAIAASNEAYAAQQYLNEALQRSVEIMTPASYVIAAVGKKGKKLEDPEALKERLRGFYKDYNPATDRRVARRMFELVMEHVKELPDVFRRAVRRSGRRGRLPLRQFGVRRRDAGVGIRGPLFARTARRRPCGAAGAVGNGQDARIAAGAEGGEPQLRRRTSSLYRRVDEAVPRPRVGGGRQLHDSPYLRAGAALRSGRRRDLPLLYDAARRHGEGGFYELGICGFCSFEGIISSRRLWPL